MKTYKILLEYYESGEREEIELTTDRLDWSMEQYQRNRLPFKWELL